MTDRVKRPAYQWYPGDHRRDTALQACTFEARALWREMLDLMHDGEPYGHLTAGGVAIDPATLARVVGVTPARARKALAELEARGVFSRTAAGVIYSRRMVKDEHLRCVRATAGRLGGNPAITPPRDKHPGPDLDNPLLNQTDEQNPTPAVAVAVADVEQSSSLKDRSSPPPPLAGPRADLRVHDASAPARDPARPSLSGGGGDDAECGQRPRPPGATPAPAPDDPAASLAHAHHRAAYRHFAAAAAAPLAFAYEVRLLAEGGERPGTGVVAAAGWETVGEALHEMATANARATPGALRKFVATQARPAPHPGAPDAPPVNPWAALVARVPTPA